MRSGGPSYKAVSVDGSGFGVSRERVPRQSLVTTVRATLAGWTSAFDPPALAEANHAVF